MDIGQLNQAGEGVVVERRIIAAWIEPPLRSSEVEKSDTAVLWEFSLGSLGVPILY